MVALYQQHRRHLATVIGALLVIAIGLSLANSVLFVLEHLSDGASDATVTSNTPPVLPVVTSSTESGISIAKYNLFGRVQQDSPVQAPADAPATRLNLELQGVFTATVVAESSAIVAERGKDGELFRIGDRLPGNALLEAVFDDHILLKRGGQIEKLMFSDSGLRQQFKADDENLAGPDPTSSQGTVDRVNQIRERIASRQSTPRQPVVQPGANLKNFVTEYRDRIESDQAGLLSELGVGAVSEGQASGYRISDQLPSQQMMQAGLQEGDIILSVNGKPIGDVTSDSALIDQAMAERRVRVEIQRNDRRFFLTIPIPDE